MKRKSGSKSLKNKKSRKTSFGSKKKGDKCIPGMIDIKMCVAPFSGRRTKKSQWMKLPPINVGEIVAWTDGKVYKPEDDPNKATLDDVLIHMWYDKFQVSTALKLIFIRFIQNCIKLSYGGKVPKWLKDKCVSSTPLKKINTNFNNARRALACISLYRHDDGHAVGHLLTRASIQKMQHARNEQQVMSAIAFKDIGTLQSECKNYGGRYPSSVHTLVKDSELAFDNRIFDEKLCKKYFEAMKAQFKACIEGEYVDVLLYGGYSTQTDVGKIINELERINKIINKNNLNVDENNHLSTYFLRMHEQFPDNEQITQQYETWNGSQATTPSPSRRTLPLQASNRSSMVPKGNTNVENPVPVKGDNNDDVLENAKKLKNRLPPDPSKGKNPNGFGRSRRSGFGMRGTNSMTGYVRPYRLTAMEDYTGMTPSMYGRHINSRTGIPTGMASPRLSQANSYYGSYRLGERLDPMNRFGRRRRKAPVKKTTKRKAPVKKTTKRKAPAKKTTKRKVAKKTAKRKTPVKRKTTKRKTTKRKTKSDFGKFFF